MAWLLTMAFLITGLCDSGYMSIGYYIVAALFMIADKLGDK